MINDKKADELASKIMDVEKRRMYLDYPRIMTELSADEDSMQIISELASRLPSGAFQNFFLCNLTAFGSLGVNGYKRLYELCCGKELALYNLTLCLVVVGGVRGEELRRLCENCLEVERIEQFRGAFKSNSAPIEDDRVFSYYQKTFGVSKIEILSFRKSFLSA